MDPVQLWNAIKEELRESISTGFSFANYVDTLTPLQVLENKNNTVTLHLSTNHEQVADEWLNPSSSYYLAFMQAAMTATMKLYGQPTFIVPSVTYISPQPTSLFEVPATDAAPEQQNTTGTSPVAADFVTQSILNPEFRFETFVSSDENREAYAVAQAVADNPGTQWNPLLIYGGVGLGKTHLMQAIGNKVLENNPNAKVKFITNEDFINDFTEALRRGQKETEAFTRENHQIVLTSDKLPKEIPGLEMRLVTRFGQGYSANITKPDLPTRVAILRNKSDQENLNIPNDVIDEIAAAVDTNVRDLEGVFNQVAGKLRFASQPVTVDTARDILETMNFKRQRAITIPIIQDTVAKFFDVTVQDLNGKKRNKEIVVPRQIAMYLARELTQDSLPQIGRAFGGKDHTTVMHSTEKIDNAIENDALLADQVQKIREELSN